MSDQEKKYAEWWEPPFAAVFAIAALMYVAWGCYWRITALEAQLGLKMDNTGKYIQIEKPSDKP